MSKGLIATATTLISAPTGKVWNALVDPEAIRQYMFGATVVSDWKIGNPILWRGEWQGKPYEDKGRILEFEPGRRVSYSHYSPLSGVPDTPENYHTVTVELKAEGGGTRASLTQDNNASEAERLESEKNWQGMLEAMKKYLEG